jgi:hypothetical protein
LQAAKRRIETLDKSLTGQELPTFRPEARQFCRLPVHDIRNRGAMRLRSPKELAFRLNQEIASRLDYVLSPPVFRGRWHKLPLPDPALTAAQLRETPAALKIQALAERILNHEFPIFEQTLSTGPKIEWRRDYANGAWTPVAWSKQIPFLDFTRSGDHKFIWELNRHQHLITLAQAWVLFEDSRCVAEIECQIASWHEQNPFVRSANWSSALELAFRSLSWLWVLHIAGEALSESTRSLLSTSLYQHGVAIRHNLSTYFAPNTHILGEGVALHVIGIALGISRWEEQGAHIVREQVTKQVLPDGFHFELSSYYHLYALDMFLFHYVLAGRPPYLEAPLCRMAKVMESFLDEKRRFPLIGDDDGGRLFHPYGHRAEFASASLATCAALFPGEMISARPEDLAEQAIWWLGPSSLKPRPLADLTSHLAASGMTVFRRGRLHVTFDCGPFSSGGAGHSHADCLALTLRCNGEEVLIDPGTFTYVADETQRDWFRGTRAHSTICVGARDQADATKPFRWDRKPEVKRLASTESFASAQCIAGRYAHKRNIHLESVKAIRIQDEIESSGEEEIEQIWHLALPPERLAQNRFRIGPAVIECDPALAFEVEPAFRSRVFGSREPSYLLVGAIGVSARASFETRIVLDGGNA